MQREFYDKLKTVEDKLTNLFTSVNDSPSRGQLSVLSNDFDQVQSEFQECGRFMLRTIDLFGDLNMSQALNTMNSSYNTVQNHLRDTKSSLDKSLAKDQSFEHIYNELLRFINAKTSYLAHIESPSSNLNKVIEQIKSHEIFENEIDNRKSDLVRLSEFYSESDEEARGMLKEIEAKWVTLTNEADTRKEKLFTASSMIEQFDNVCSKINDFIKEVESMFELDEPIETVIDTLNSALDKIRKQESLNSLIRIENNLRSICTDDSVNIGYQSSIVKIELDRVEMGAIQRINELRAKERLNLNILQAKQEFLEFEQKIETNSNLEDLKSQLKQKFTDLNSEVDDDSKKKLTIELESIYEKLDKLIDLKIDEEKSRKAELDKCLKDLSIMETRLGDVEALLSAQLNNDSLKVKQNKLDDIKDTLNAVNEKLKNANDLRDKDSLLNDTIRSLAEKLSVLNEIQKKEEATVKAQTDALGLLQSKISRTNSDIAKLSSEFDLQSCPYSSTICPKSLSVLINEHEAYEKRSLGPLRAEVDSISDDAKQKFPNNDVLDLQLEKLESHYNKLEAKFKERCNLLELALFKSKKFEEKMKFLSEGLSSIETRLDSLSHAKLSLDNLNTIETQLDECESLARHLLDTSNEIDDFKEISEELMQGCDNLDERDVTEKRVDSLILRWNILTRQLDEKRVNLDFLDTHLRELSDNYIESVNFVSSLNTKYTTELSLNCIEPLVIKCQYEAMREINDILIQNQSMISELKIDARNLVFIYEDFTSEAKDTLVNSLPKTISSQAVLSLALMLDKPEIESRVDEVEIRYNEYTLALGNNMSLMHRLYPLCEKFAHGLAQLGQAMAKCESELDWLQSSSDNESSQREKEELLNELRNNAIEHYQVIESLEGKRFLNYKLDFNDFVFSIHCI